MNALDVIVDGDLGEVPLRYYLGKLLYSLWIDGEGFSGKRPFGNSGWDIDVARAIYEAGVISGTKNKWGDWDIEWPDVTEVIQKAINEAFNITVEKKFK